MGSIVVLDIAYAAGIAFSPTSIIVLILILLDGIADRRTRGCALAFLLGWVIGLAVLGIVGYALARGGNIMAEVVSDSARPMISLLVGLALLYYVLREWKQNAKKKEQAEMPRWLKATHKVVAKTGDVMTPWRALLLAIIMSALSPKNVMLALALCLAFVGSGLSNGEQIVLLVLFVLLGSLTIGVPVVYVVMRGDSAGDTLMTWKTWITENATHVAHVFVGFLGVVMVVKSVVEIVSGAVTSV